jgi:predicted dehydrogenase
LKVLVVGYGSIGKRHVKNLLSNTKLQIIIYTKRKDLTSLNRKRVKISNSLSECLMEKPDIGFITNETAYHVPIAIKLAREGIDLFIEKPLSNSMKDIAILKNIVKRKKLIVQMGYHLRFHECIKKIGQILKEKKIGKVISVQVENGSYLPDWHAYEDYRKGYVAKKELGGGVILTQSHDLDYLYWFFGNPKSVFSVTGKFSDLKISTEDFSASIISFKDKIISQVHLDYFQRPVFRNCKIKGTNGVIYWNQDVNEVKLYSLKKRKWQIIFKLTKFDRNQMYIDEVKHFLRCVRTRKETINGLQDGINIMKIALALKKSSQSKKMIRIKK